MTINKYFPERSVRKMKSCKIFMWNSKLSSSNICDKISSTILAETFWTTSFSWAALDKKSLVEVIVRQIISLQTQDDLWINSVLKVFRF